MTAHLGIALYHRQRFPDLLQNATATLLAVLQNPAGDLQPPALRVFVGDEDRGPATVDALQAIPLTELTRGDDRPLRVATADKRIGALVWDPIGRQRRAMSSDLVAVVIEATRFDSRMLVDLASAVDVRYGFVEVASTHAGAWDEATWPERGSRRSGPGERRHSDAWIQLMRSFGRPEIGVGVPDIYWANIFGNALVNELRRHGSWDALEALVNLRYLDNGAVAFSLGDEPCPWGQPELDERARRVGDVLAPLGLMQRALNHARQGDVLLLDSLVETGDRRLLWGLAFPEGLDAFRALAGASEADVPNVEAARAWLHATRGERPRGYGEPDETRDVSHKNVPAQAADAEPNTAQPGPESDTDAEQEVAGERDAPAEVTAPNPPAPAAQREARGGGSSGPETPPLAAVRPEVLAAVRAASGFTSEPAFDRDAPQWRIRSMSRGAVRFELGSVRWTPTADPTERFLEIELVNELPCAVELTRLQRVLTDDDGGFDVVDTGVPRGLVASGGGHSTCAFGVPAPTGDQRLSLLSGIEFRLRQSIADLVVEGGRLRVLSAQDGEAMTLVHQGWPARVVVSPMRDRGLALRIRNTMQMAWRSWQVTLVPAGSGATAIAGVTRGDGVLGAGAEVVSALELGARADGAYALWLEADGAAAVSLAEFFHEGKRSTDG